MKGIALLLIDIQEGFDDLNYWGGERNNPQAEENCKILLEAFRKHHLPVFHIQHSSRNPDSPLHICSKGFKIKNIVHPLVNEPVIEKEVNSAFIGTNLHGRLEKQGITKLVIVGLTTDHCVSTTTRMAGNFGFDTLVISDATATFNKIGIDGEKYDADLIHKKALASLRGAFAEVLRTREFLDGMDEKEK
ncbi:MAG TPA: cysteine hydrolase [Bacteroidales bacterium]|nr:cysteine hydrolase [Bacteroidales bacterium]